MFQLIKSQLMLIQELLLDLLLNITKIQLALLFPSLELILMPMVVQSRPLMQLLSKDTDMRLQLTNLLKVYQLHKS